MAQETRRRGCAPRLRALFLACFLCGACKSSSAREAQGRDRDRHRHTQNNDDDAILSTSRDWPPTSSRETAKEGKARKREAKRKKKTERRQQGNIFNWLCCFRHRRYTSHDQINYHQYIHAQVEKANKRWGPMPMKEGNAFRMVEIQEPRLPDGTLVYATKERKLTKRDLEWRPPAPLPTLLVKEFNWYPLGTPVRLRPVPSRLRWTYRFIEVILRCYTIISNCATILMIIRLGNMWFWEILTDYINWCFS